MYKFVNKLICLSILCLSISCKAPPLNWQMDQQIELDSIAPIGLTIIDNSIWVSDGDNNRLVRLDRNGDIQQIISDFERPMHIDSKGDELFIPEYGADQITITTKLGAKRILPIKDSLDAPAGVSVVNNEIAIADFYNHRILYFDGNSWTSYGTEGKDAGQFYYPTDVQIIGDLVYVADAYNHRIQVLDKKGNYIRFIGITEKMNAATGLFVDYQHIFVTDFENNRVLIYDLDGELLQALEEGLSKPTDIIVEAGIMYLINYKGKNIQKYVMK